MGLSDPFSTTYEGAFKANSQLGQGIGDALKDTGNLAAKQIQLQKNRQMATDMLSKFGMIKTEQPSLEDLTQGAKDFAKSQGLGDLNINEGDNPDQAKQNIMGIYKALNIPLPKGKTTLNLAPGTKYDPIKGETSFEGPQMNPTMMAMSMMGLGGSNMGGNAGGAQGISGTQGVLNSPSPKTPEEKETALNSLPPAVGSNIRLMLDDKLTAKDITGMNSQVRSVYTALAQHIDPNYDPTQVPTRQALRKDFTSGTTSKKLVSANTAIHHADTAYDQIQALDNGPIKAANGFGNYLKSQSGDPRVDVLNTTLSFLNRETPKAIAAGVVTNQDKQDFDHNLNSAQSKEVASKVIDDYITLLGGRIQPDVERWQNTFGETSQFPAMGKSTVAILNKHGFNYNPATGAIDKQSQGNSQDLTKMTDDQLKALINGQ